MKQTRTIKALGIFALFFSFFWLTQSLRAEIEDVIEMEPSVVEEVASVAVQVCRDSRCLGHGSGFHLYNGYFITAAHVTEPQSKRWIKNSLGQQQEALVMWAARQSDFSLLYVEAWDFLSPPENTITCEEQKIGEEITVVGYPADLGNITSEGKILRKLDDDDKVGRWVEPYVADINIFMGNSGGPAINSEGNIFGIAVGGYRGTNFSLIESVSKICEILPAKKASKTDDNE